ncbi:MAG: hypothetical protein ACRC7P_07125, partial [Enterovibrio sp.]
MKKHQRLKRKQVVKKKQIRPKITVDEMYDTAKPALGLDLPDDVYANIFSKAKEQKISLADDNLDTFKQAAAAAGQNLNDEDIWGAVGLKRKKTPPTVEANSDTGGNTIWQKIRDKLRMTRGRDRLIDDSAIDLPARRLLKGSSGIIDQEDLAANLQRMRMGAESEISAIGKATAHRSNTQDNDYVAAVLGRKDPRLEVDQDLPWMSKVTDNIESSSDLSAVKVRGISAEDSLSSSKALYSAGNVLETAAAAEEFLAGKTVLQTENIDEGGGISRSGLADTTIESSPEKIIVKKDGAAAIEIEVDEANSGLSKKERFKRATQKLQAKKAEINAAEAAEAELSAKSVGQSAIGANAEQDLSAFANKATQLDEPEILRAMYIYGEELQLENQRMLALSQQVETEVADFLRKQGDVPSDWKLMPPRGDTEIEDFTFSYRGTDTELQGQTKTVKLTDKLADRWRRLSAEVQEISTRISDSQFSVKLQSFVSSKAYHRAGKALGLASKAMNVYSLYNLAFESQNIRNLRPHYQVSFVLGAMDTVLDAVSNTLNLSNKLFKMAHLGVANTALQSSARAVAQISSVIGIGASIGSVIAHSVALGQAETPFEYDIAATNLAFATTGLVLSAIAMAFPVAGPLIAAVSLLLFVIQMAVMNHKMELEKIRIAGEQFDGFFENTEKLLEILEIIATTNLEEVRVVGEGSQQRIIIEQKAAAATIEISSEKITMKRKEGAFSVVYLDNTEAESYKIPDKIVKQAKWEPDRMPYLIACDATKNNQPCSANVPPFLQEYVRNSGMNFPQGGKKAQYVMQIRGSLPVQHTKKEKATNAVLPCLLLNKNAGDAGAINQTLFEQDLNQFLSSNYTLPTSDQAPPVIMLS